MDVLKKIGNGIVITLLFPIFIIMMIKECGGSKTETIITKIPDDYL